MLHICIEQSKIHLLVVEILKFVFLLVRVLIQLHFNSFPAKEGCFDKGNIHIYFKTCSSTLRSFVKPKNLLHFDLLMDGAPVQCNFHSS